MCQGICLENWLGGIQTEICLNQNVNYNLTNPDLLYTLKKSYDRELLPDTRLSCCSDTFFNRCQSCDNIFNSLFPHNFHKKGIKNILIILIESVSEHKFCSKETADYLNNFFCTFKINSTLKLWNAKATDPKNKTQQKKKIILHL